MDDDLAFVNARIPTYCGYETEVSRHETDKQVRAYVGEALSDVEERARALDGEVIRALDSAIGHCEFTDYAYTRKVEHAKLSEADTAHLIGADRRLIELADRVRGASDGELLEIMAGVDAAFAARRNAL